MFRKTLTDVGTDAKSRTLVNGERRSAPRNTVKKNVTGFFGPQAGDRGRQCTVHRLSSSAVALGIFLPFILPPLLYHIGRFCLKLSKNYEAFLSFKHPNAAFISSLSGGNCFPIQTIFGNDALPQK